MASSKSNEVQGDCSIDESKIWIECFSTFWNISVLGISILIRIIWLERGCQSVRDQWTTDWRLVDDCFWEIYLWLQKDLQLFGDWSVSAWHQVSDHLVTKNCATTATDWRQAINQVPTSPWPHCDHQNPFYSQFCHREFPLAASKTSLRLNHSCDLSVISVTSRRSVSDLL